ncbi:MAG: FHA domain-containing protein, partial [Candidatus Electrothrix sp. AUS4]|nr:FHA domain-containing protein [Candidatus Electrothrix sp. AUS4]
MNIPDIKIQLIHIDGPLKGEIQEFFQDVVLLGRHPDCQVVFPGTCAAVSRKHAEIRREGNRFKLIDTSTNGTLVNGKAQKEVFLKNGDVLILAGGDGPKISFLSTSAPAEKKERSPVPPSPGYVPSTPSVHTPEGFAAPHSAGNPLPGDSIARMAKSLVVQYGATLQSFQEVPVIIGSDDECDCTLSHPSLLARHARIFFRDDQYWIEDLTGRKLLTINLRPIPSAVPLQPDICLALTPDGPNFQYLGNGRLVEIDDAA